MAQIEFNKKTYPLAGELPNVGDKAYDFRLTANNFSEKKLSDYPGKKLVLSIFPSIDTPVCAASVRQFNDRAARLPNARILCISADLPFAQKEFCGSAGLNNVETLSSFRCQFGKDYGVQIAADPMRGLLSRTIIIINERGRIDYLQHAKELMHTPLNLAEVFAHL